MEEGEEVGVAGRVARAEALEEAVLVAVTRVE